MRKALDAQEDKTVSTDSLIELAECVLKNNIFEHNTSFYKQLRGTAIGTKMTPSYAIIFMGDLQEKLVRDCDKKPLAWWRYIDDIFMLWQLGKKELKKIFELLPSHNKIYCQLFTEGDKLSRSISQDEKYPACH